MSASEGALREWVAGTLAFKPTRADLKRSVTRVLAELQSHRAAADTWDQGLTPLREKAQQLERERDEYYAAASDLTVERNELQRRVDDLVTHLRAAEDELSRLRPVRHTSYALRNAIRDPLLKLDELLTGGDKT